MKKYELISDEHAYLFDISDTEPKRYNVVRNSDMALIVMNDNDGPIFGFVFFC